MSSLTPTTIYFSNLRTFKLMSAATTVLRRCSLPREILERLRDMHKVERVETRQRMLKWPEFQTLTLREFANSPCLLNLLAGSSPLTISDVALHRFTATFAGQPVLVQTLVGAPQIQRVMFRLPDGNMDGSGYPSTGYTSLRQL